MGRTRTINLISTNITHTPEFAGLFGILQKLSYGSLILFIVSGLIVGGVFVYLSARQTALRSEKDMVMATIHQQSIKEGLLLTVKQRVAVIDKIMDTQKNFSRLFDVVSDVASVGQLDSLSIDDTDRATIEVHVNSIEDAVSLVDLILVHTTAQAITKPALASFTQDKESGFTLSVSFIPKF